MSGVPVSGRPARRVRVLRVVLVVLTAVLIPVLTGLLAKPFEELAARNWLLPAALVLVALALYLLLEGLLARRPADDLDEVAAELAEVVGEEWRREAAVRQLDRGQGLVTFRWSPTDRPVADRRGRTEAGEREVTDFPGLVDAYLRVSSRRLAIIGAAGSGKTSLALLLTLGLVERRLATGTGPVPVKLSVADWDPREQGLIGWMTEELTSRFLFLRDTARYGVDAPRRLLESGRVLPVLDGLDELRLNGEPTGRGTTARQEGVRQIRLVLERLPGLILTCRTDQFEEAVGDGRPIPGTAVVELRPLRPREVVGYLSGVIAEGDRERWRPVFDALGRDPGGPVARALSTPLMVTLARDVYEHRGTVPAEMLDRERFPDEAALRRHLLRGLLPAVYPDLPVRDRRTGWHGEDVRRWLGFLAAEMTARELRNIAWWRLPELAGRPQRVLAGLLGGVLVALVSGLGVGAVAWLKWGMDMGLLLGVPAALLGGAWMAVPAARNLPAPVELQFGGRGRWRIMLLGSMFAALAGGAAGWLLKGAGGGVATGALLGVPLGLVYGGAQPDATVRVASPRALLHRDRRAMLFFGAAYGVTTGGAAAWLANPVLGAVFGVGSALCGGLLCGLPWVIALRAGEAGVIASVHLTLYGLLMAPSGKSPPPWKLMRFLEDAHRRDVLLRVGPVYQFRHASLQEVLAERTP